MLATPLAHAVDDSAFARCRGIADTANRLACYDAADKRHAGRHAGATDRRAEGGARKTFVSTADRAPSTPAAPQQQAAAQSFGMENRAPEVELPTTMQSTIPGHFEGWGRKRASRSPTGRCGRSPTTATHTSTWKIRKVVIRRGMMGGFFLEVENSNRSPRVRRVQ